MKILDRSPGEGKAVILRRMPLQLPRRQMLYCTVTCRVTLCVTAWAPAPPLAVTVAIKELDEVPPVEPEVPRCWQPLTAVKEPAKIRNAQNRKARFLPGQANKTVQARVIPPSDTVIPIIARGPDGMRSASIWDGLLMLRATLTGVDPLRLGCAGVNVQAEPVGRPVQLSVTTPKKPRPAPGVSKTLVVPGFEPLIVTFPGFTEI